MSDKSNTVFLRLSQTMIGNTRKVNNSQVEVDADKTMIRVSKQLLESPQLEAIRSFDGKVRAWLDSRCLPFESGIRLLPVGLIEEVDAKLEEFGQERAALVDSFVSAYEELKAAAKVKLNGLYDPRNYPSVSEVRGKFAMEHQYLSFDTPATLSEISSDVFNREREKLAQRLDDAYTEARTILRETCRDLVGHLREKLEPTADGKRKRLHETTLTGLQEFLANFSVRNITDDAELTRIVEQAKAVLEGRNVEALRDFDAVRSQVHQDLQAIESEIDRHLIQPAHRRLSLVDDFGSAT